MRIHLNRYTAGLTRWGIFTNIFTPSDWCGCGLWYFHVHTPAVQVQVYATSR